MNELKPRPCPFCGCEPILERFEDYAFSIKCTHNYFWSEPDENGVRTAADIAIYADIKGKYNYETNDWEYTEEEINNCKKAVIEAWNTRYERTCKFIAGFCNYPECTECGESWDYVPNYCPNCGARVIEDE